MHPLPQARPKIRPVTAETRESQGSARCVDAFVSIGSNLARPPHQMAAAFAALERLPHTHVVARSSLYRTDAHGVASRQPAYLNAVVRLSTTLSADALLAHLQAIERAQKRRRHARNAPRSLDLDLLTYGALKRGAGALQVPHPRLHERAFVLVPLLEIAPDLVLPGLGRAKKFLPRTRRQRVARLT